MKAHITGTLLVLALALTPFFASADDKPVKNFLSLSLTGIVHVEKAKKETEVSKKHPKSAVVINDRILREGDIVEIDGKIDSGKLGAKIVPGGEDYTVKFRFPVLIIGPIHKDGVVIRIAIAEDDWTDFVLLMKHRTKYGLEKPPEKKAEKPKKKEKKK